MLQWKKLPYLYTYRFSRPFGGLARPRAQSSFSQGKCGHFLFING